MNRCYKLYNDYYGKKYFEAQDFCKAQGGYVVEITSQAENEIITELLPGK